MSKARDLAKVGSVASLVSLKNRIINGAMVIDQRNAGASYTVPSGGGYSIDRWHCEASQASKYTAQQSSTAPAGFVNSLKLTSSSAYSLGAGDYFQLQQSIEGFNTADFNFGTANAKTITLSFWVNASVTGTYGMFLINNASNRIYPTSYTVNSANTWEQKTITVAGDTTGTWDTTNNRGIRVAWTLGYGSTYAGATPNAWTGGSLYVPSGCVNFVGTNGATFYITGVQLEAGSTATPFEFRPYGQELALCQRYLPAYIYESSSGSEIIGWFRGGSGSTYGSTQIVFPVTARVPPTGISVTGSSYAVSGLSFTTITFGSASTRVGQLDVSGGSGMTALAMYTFTAGATGSKILFTGSEL
jgi:hypothetical protein